MRRTVILLSLLLCACDEPAPNLSAKCTLVQTDRIEGLEGYPDYVRCVEANTGERLYFLWSDMEKIIASGGQASADWVAEHRLPDEWFGTDGYPVEGAFG